MQTGDNNKFLRFWYEVDINNIGFGMSDFTQAKNSGKKWFPYNKGGDFRKWYGNQEYLVNWENDGYEIKNFKDAKGKLRSRPQNTDFYFRENIGWTKISSSDTSFRFFPKGFILGNASGNVFPKNSEFKYYLLGLLNSKISSEILKIMSPTLNYTEGNMALIPVLFSKHYENINNYVKDSVNLCEKDWNFKETSWEFKKSPFCLNEQETFENSFEQYENIKQDMFNKLKNHDQIINNEFLEIYNLENEISSEIEDKYVSIDLPSLNEEIKNFISYFIGCLFGRYSLDYDGLIYAGGKYNTSKYTKFIPDEDNIVPILDTEYFSDDIINSFEEFLKISFSPETLEENIKFIANALGNKGKTYRETIRKYFLKDFFNDHKKMYKKTPIYWQFDSGKEDGFKALIYMHRYTPDTVARVRTDYLHSLQKALEESIHNNEQIITNSTNSKEKTAAKKENTKLKKQLEETIKYDEALAHVANQQIAIDLDDGVKNNYELFQNVEIGNKKINLLKKI